MKKHLMDVYPGVAYAISECGMVLKVVNITRYYTQVNCIRCKCTKKYKEWINVQKRKKRK